MVCPCISAWISSRAILVLVTLSVYCCRRSKSTASLQPCVTSGFLVCPMIALRMDPAGASSTAEPESSDFFFPSGVAENALGSVLSEPESSEGCHGANKFNPVDSLTYLVPLTLLSTILPHGFCKVIVSECDEVFLQMRLAIPGYGGFYPFAAEVRHLGYACWANSRRFAIVARNAPQCAIIAEIMHA